MDNLYKNLMEALEAEDRYACINYVTDALLKGRVNIADLYENILKPALNNIECKVGDKKVCIWKEHVRSSIVRSVIECCYPYVIKERDLCNVPKRNQYVVVLCPDGEYHELGARMVSDFFTICGFDSIFIGSSTPKEELFNILDSINPIYIALSITNYYNLVSAKKTISEIRKKAHKELKIIVGGNAFLRNPDAYREIGADALVNTFKDIKALKITDFKP